MIDPSAAHECSDEFIVHLTNCQNRLYAYIFSLLPDSERARDVLQETNIVLWRKADQFVANTSFEAWACKVAYFEVLAERRRRGKDRHLFSDTLVEELSQETSLRLTNFDDRAVALEECLQRLNPHQRDYLLERYRPGGSVKSVASTSGVKPGAAAVALYRIRRALMDCVRRKLAQERTAWT